MKTMSRLFMKVLKFTSVNWMLGIKDDFFKC